MGMTRNEVAGLVAVLEARFNGLGTAAHDTMTPAELRSALTIAQGQLNSLMRRRWNVTKCVHCGTEFWSMLKPFCSQKCAAAHAKEQKAEREASRG